MNSNPEPAVATSDDANVELCGMTGHDWRPYEYEQFNRPHTSWRCVWCHAVACGNYSDSDPCFKAYHHWDEHLSRAGVVWPLGGDRRG